MKQHHSIFPRQHPWPAPHPDAGGMHVRRTGRTAPAGTDPDAAPSPSP